MRRVSILLIVSLPISLKAQELSDTSKNELKLNLSALAFRNIAVQYERKISKKASFAISAHLLPFGKLPYPRLVSDIADVKNVEFNQANIGAFGIIPEFRFYPGRKGALRGFYLGAFINYAQYKTDLPIHYNNKTGVFNGNISTVTGGLQIGVQSKLFRKIFLDIWILGPNYGASSGNLIFKGDLEEMEQSALRFSLEDVKENFPVKFIKLYKVDHTGGTIKVKGPWTGLRGAGINIAFLF